MGQVTFLKPHTVIILGQFASNTISESPQYSPGQFVCCNPAVESRQAHQSAWCRRTAAARWLRNVPRRRNRDIYAAATCNTRILLIFTVCFSFTLTRQRKRGYQLDSGRGLDGSLAMTYGNGSVCSRGNWILKSTSHVCHPGARSTSGEQLQFEQSKDEMIMNFL